MNPAQVSPKNSASRNARPAAFGQSRDRHQCRLRPRSVVRRTRKIELGLNADIESLGRALALRRPGTRALGDFIFDVGGRGCLLERQSGLGVVRVQVTSARAVQFQAPGDLHAPFGLRSLAERVGSNGYRLWNFAFFDSRNITERTTFGVVEQEGATLRADTNHWSVLRCGSPVERTNHTRGIRGPGDRPVLHSCGRSGNTGRRPAGL